MKLVKSLSGAKRPESQPVVVRAAAQSIMMSPAASKEFFIDLLASV